MRANSDRSAIRSSTPRVSRVILVIAVVLIGAVAIITIHRFNVTRRVILITTDLPIDDHDGLSWMIGRFSRSFPGYSVELRFAGTEQNQERRNDKTDVYVVSSGSNMQYQLTNGNVVDIPAGVVPTSGYNAGFLDAFSRSSRASNGQVSKTVFAIPIVWAPFGLFVNRSVMQENRVPIPQSWDGMIDAIHSVAGMPAPVPIAIAGSVAGRLELVAKILSLNGGPSAHGLVETFLREGLIHPTSERLTEEDTALMVRDGRVAMVLGPTTLRRFIDVGSAPHIQFVPIPTYDGRPPVVAARVVAASLTRRGAAKSGPRDFIAFSARPEVQEGFVAASGSRPTYNSVHSSARNPDADGAVIARLGRIARLIIVE